MLYAHAISWIVLSVTSLIAVFTLLFVIISLYRVLRSLDLFVTSLLLVCMGNAGVVVLVPALLHVLRVPWSGSMCRGYVWSVLTFRIAGLLNLGALGFERLLLIRREGKYKYKPTVSVVSTLFIIWVAAMGLAAAPAIVWSILDTPITQFSHKIANDTECSIFAHDLHRDIGIVMIVLETASMVVSLTCAFDAYCSMSHLTNRTLFASTSSGAASMAKGCLEELSVTDVQVTSANNIAKAIRAHGEETSNNDPDIGHVNPTFSTLSKPRRGIDKAFNGNEHKMADISPDNATTPVIDTVHGPVLSRVYTSVHDQVTSRDIALDTVHGSVLYGSALDSCRLVLIITFLMCILDHIPYTVSILNMMLIPCLTILLIILSLSV